MAQSHRRLISDQAIQNLEHGKHRLDEMDPAREAKHLVCFQPTDMDIRDIIAKARLTVPNIASAEEVLKVGHFNPFCVMGLARKSKFNPDAPVTEGFIAALPLNELGLRLLMLGSFDAISPDLKLLAKPDERPAGIYLWGVYAPGSLAAGIAYFKERISSPLYAGISIYSRPVTESGRRYLHVMGFSKGTESDGIEAPNVWVFPREPQLPPYDSYVPNTGSKNITVTVARTFDDLMRVAAIRSAVYIGEQECPYEEEYDGNDLAAAHLLVYIGDEPAGCLRVRFFADFVKFERMAVRKEFRHTRSLFVLCQAGLAYARKKGYRRAYAHSQIRLARIWQKLGFVPYEGSQRFIFSDFEYIEIAAELEPDQEALKIGTDPYFLIRPEGRWHKPGILETSISRAATSPSVAKKSDH